LVWRGGVSSCRQVLGSNKQPLTPKANIICELRAKVIHKFISKIWGKKSHKKSKANPTLIPKFQKKEEDESKMHLLNSKKYEKNRKQRYTIHPRRKLYVLP
jgi:hypothetical protein